MEGSKCLDAATGSEREATEAWMQLQCWKEKPQRAEMQLQDWKGKQSKDIILLNDWKGKH